MNEKRRLECVWYSVCPMKRFYETGRLDGKWIKSYCLAGGRNCVRRMLEEQGRFHPDWMLPNGFLDDRLKQG